MEGVNDNFHGNWLLRCALGSINVVRPLEVLLLPDMVVVSMIE